jgi:hypothetical protein
MIQRHEEVLIQICNPAGYRPPPQNPSTLLRISSTVGHMIFILDNSSDGIPFGV